MFNSSVASAMGATSSSASGRKKKVTTNPFHEVRRREFARRAECEKGATLRDVPPGYFTPSLQEICAAVIADTFDEQQGVESLEPELYRLVIGQLGTDLRLERAVQRVKSDAYWKACALDKWSLGKLSDFTPTKKLQPPERGGWKRLYLERTLEEHIMSIDPSTFGEGRGVNGTGQGRGSSSSGGNAGSGAPLNVSNLGNGSAGDGAVSIAEEQAEAGIASLCTICGADVYALHLTHQVYHLDLFELFSKLPHLEEFAITYNTLNTGVNYRPDMLGMKQQDALHMQKVLRGFPSLTSLSLTGNAIDAELLRCICAGLVKNSTLVFLDLSYNKIGDAGAAVLSTVLMKKDSSIQNLNLTDNWIRADGAKSLAQMFAVNTTLRTVSLRLNRLDDLGGHYVFEGLRRNSGVQRLDVANNEMGAEAARSLAEVLRTNRTLTALDISGNNFQEEGGRLIAMTAQEGCGLCEIDARMSGMADPDVRVLVDMARNRVEAEKLQEIESLEQKIHDAIERKVAEKVRKTHGM